MTYKRKDKRKDGKRLPGYQELIHGHQTPERIPSFRIVLPPLRDILVDAQLQHFDGQASEQLNAPVFSDYPAGGNSDYIDHRCSGSHTSLGSYFMDTESTATFLASTQSSRRQPTIMESPNDVVKESKSNSEADRRDKSSMAMAALGVLLDALEFDGISWAVPKSAELGEQNKRNFGGTQKNQLAILYRLVELLVYLSGNRECKPGSIYTPGMDTRQLCDKLEKFGVRTPEVRPDFLKRARERAKKEANKKRADRKEEDKKNVKKGRYQDWH